MPDIDVLTLGPSNHPIAAAPRAYLCVTEYSKDSEGRIMVSAELANDAEVDFWTDRLIDQLEAARKKAKRHLALRPSPR